MVARRVGVAMLAVALTVGLAQPAMGQEITGGRMPQSLTVDGAGCLSPEPTRTTGAAPQLGGVPLLASGLARADLEIRTLTESDNVREWVSDVVSSGAEVSWQVDPPLVDGRYRWRMRSVDPEETGASWWSGWCEFRVDSAMDAEPDPDAPESVECPVGELGGEVLEAADESAALVLAQACDMPVEAVSERDFDTRVLAQPDGLLVAEQFTQPQWAHDADGDWVGVDPSFEVGADGTVSTVAAVSQVVVSAGGSGPLLTATDPDGGSVSLSWPDPLPAPVIDGASVTYPEVYADVDLRVSAGVDGFSYVLVVKSAAAAASPELAQVSMGVATGGGLQVLPDADGAIVVQDPEGEAVFASPGAYMWDSSAPLDVGADGFGVLAEGEGSGDVGEPPPGRFTEMPLELDGSTLTVEPDQGLLSDPGVEFPVYIDPPFSGKRMHWANVHQQQPNRGWTDDAAWPREKEMRVGRLGYWPGYPCGDACGLWRSAVRFNIKSLAGRQIVSAKVKAVQTHTSGCGAYGLQLWYVNAFTSGVTWNQMAGRWQDHLQTESPTSSNRTGGCSGTTSTGVTFDNAAVRGRVQSHADAGHGSLSFGFRSSDESSISPYRRIAIGSVKLEVEYNRLAQPPTGLSTDGRGCSTSGPGPWLTTRRPTLSGKPRDPDGRVGAHLQVRTVGSSKNYYQWKSPTNRTHNKVVNHRLPSGEKLPSGDYRWRMRSLDSHPRGTDSDWRQWCYFRVDVTSPTTPTVELLGDPPAAGEQVSLRLRSSDAHSGLDRFWYGVDEEAKRTSVSSSGTATITVTAPAAGGRTWIYLWSEDKAGNDSNRAVFDFFAARYVEATPAAAWRLDGDGYDDSGNGHELHLGGGVSWSSDAAFPGMSSLDFDGTGCVSTEGTVVRTDAAYTVAAWVRLDSDSDQFPVMAPAAEERPTFNFRYTHLSDRWIFELGSTPHIDETPEWATLRSAGPPVLGQWTHLAVRVDPPARHMQMFVDGALSGEQSIPFDPWHGEGPVYLGCSGSATKMWGRFQGAIHHAALWQGLLTPDEIRDAYEGQLSAGAIGQWPLRGDADDVSPFARDLQVSGGTTWVDDQFGRPGSAARVDGTGWAESSQPVVRTDRSFSVAAWAKLTDKDGFRTVVSQIGSVRNAFRLMYNADQDRWQLSMPDNGDRPASETTWHAAQSTDSPVIDQWYHLAGVYDHADNRLRLYVNGELQGTALGPAQPWHADDRLLVGAAGVAVRLHTFVGSISDVLTWRGALTDEQVAEVYGGNPAVTPLAEWHLDGDGNDSVGGHTLTPAGAEGVDYEWVEDRFCFPWSALGLQLSGAGHAATSGPVVATGESFTAAAWVKLDSLTGDYQTVLSQGGDARSGFSLQATPDGSWRFALPQADTAAASSVSAESPPGTVEVGVWTHVAGVFDLPRGEVRLYVNGELAGSSAEVTSPWSADGPFFIGAAGTASGGTSEHVHGAIDMAAAWASTLDPERIADLGGPALAPVPCL